MKLPTKLRKQPLVEATFELRFDPHGQPAAQLLPGLVFSKLGTRYERAESLPLATLPPELREQDKSLRYQALHRLVGKSASVLLGDRVVGLSRGVPYPGWAAFRTEITELLDAIKSAAFVRRIERYSLRLINVIPPFESSQLDLLDLNIELLGSKPTEHGFSLRTEINDKSFIRILQVSTNATTQDSSSERRAGLLVGIDCIRAEDVTAFWDNPHSKLNEIHEEAKLLFFSLLRERTLAALQPEYSSADA